MTVPTGTDNQRYTVYSYKNIQYKMRNFQYEIVNVKFSSMNECSVSLIKISGAYHSQSILLTMLFILFPFECVKILVNVKYYLKNSSFHLRHIYNMLTFLFYIFQICVIFQCTFCFMADLLQ